LAAGKKKGRRWGRRSVATRAQKTQEDMKKIKIILRTGWGNEDENDSTFNTAKKGVAENDGVCRECGEYHLSTQKGKEGWEGKKSGRGNEGFSNRRTTSRGGKLIRRRFRPIMAEG